MAHLDARQVWTQLREPRGEEPFALSMLEGLPDPARRLLARAIAPGTLLARSVELEVEGALQFDPLLPPVPMRGRELLAPPRGMVWSASAGRGLRSTRGSDLWLEGEGTMSWKLWGLLPAGSAQGSDVSRSLAGRLAVESFWLPSALLPAAGARWEPVDERSARVRLPARLAELAVTLSVDPEGRLERAETTRWRTAGPGGEPGPVLFAIDRLGEERTFGGYTVPTRARAGWRLGSAEEEAFFFPVVRGAAYR